MKPTIPQVVERFVRYYQRPGNGAWGSLHTVLDDGNVDSVDSNVKFAKEQGDMEGESLAKILQTMSRTQRAKLPYAVDEFIRRENDL